MEAEETGLGVMLMLSRGGSWGGCEGWAERVQGGGHEWGMGGGGGARAWVCGLCSGEGVPAYRGRCCKLTATPPLSAQEPLELDGVSVVQGRIRTLLSAIFTQS